MEMINGEKKLHVWLYKYEQDGVSPVFEVDGSRQEVEYTINNSNILSTSCCMLLLGMIYYMHERKSYTLPHLCVQY